MQQNKLAYIWGCRTAPQYDGSTAIFSCVFVNGFEALQFALSKQKQSHQTKEHSFRTLSLFLKKLTLERFHTMAYIMMDPHTVNDQFQVLEMINS